MLLSPHLILEFLAKSRFIIVKEKLQKNGLMSGKSNVSLPTLHVQRHKFVDFLYTNMQTSDK